MSETTDTPDFGTAFSADRDPVTKQFTIQGHEGFVTLRPMDVKDSLALSKVGVKRQIIDGKPVVLVEDPAAQTMFLLSRVIVDFSIPVRMQPIDGSEATWGVLTPPDPLPSRNVVRERQRMVEEKFGELDPEFFGWLSGCCATVTGASERAAGNSEEPSAN